MSDELCKHCGNVMEIDARYFRNVMHNGSYLSIGPLCDICFDKTIRIKDEKDD